MTHACALCGRAFAILVSETAEETESGQAVLGLRATTATARRA